jgi:hypothetical protein
MRVALGRAATTGLVYSGIRARFVVFDGGLRRRNPGLGNRVGRLRSVLRGQVRC